MRLNKVSKLKDLNMESATKYARLTSESKSGSSKIIFNLLIYTPKVQKIKIQGSDLHIKTKPWILKFIFRMEGHLLERVHQQLEMTQQLEILHYFDLFYHPTWSYYQHKFRLYTSYSHLYRPMHGF